MTARGIPREVLAGARRQHFARVGIMYNVRKARRRLLVGIGRRQVAEPAVIEPAQLVGDARPIDREVVDRIAREVAHEHVRRSGGALTGRRLRALPYVGEPSAVGREDHFVFVHVAEAPLLGSAPRPRLIAFEEKLDVGRARPRNRGPRRRRSGLHLGHAGGATEGDDCPERERASAPHPKMLGSPAFAVSFPSFMIPISSSHVSYSGAGRRPSS